MTQVPQGSASKVGGRRSQSEDRIADSSIESHERVRPLSDSVISTMAWRRQSTSDVVEDERLMLDYAAGDLHAFELLFRRWGPRLHAFFRRSFGNSSDADDLLQRTFLRVHRARASFRLGCPLKPWILAIAARLRQDELRLRRRLPSSDDKTLARAEEESVVPPDSIAQDERASHVRAALEELPESQRMVIHLHRYEQLTFAQIGQVLNTTEYAVKLRAFRAYRKLRVQLAPLLEEDDAA